MELKAMIHVEQLANYAAELNLLLCNAWRCAAWRYFTN
jgi:hypothetical protein